jgi:hypothetical protein
MSEHYPRIRHHDSESGELLIREVVRLVFYLPHDHHDLWSQVSRALDIYTRATGAGPDILSHAADWDYELPLDASTWEYVHNMLRPATSYRYLDDPQSEDNAQFLWLQEKHHCETFVHVYGRVPEPNGYSFNYRARLPLRTHLEGSVSVLRATLPTEYLEAHGPGRVRELALELASVLPLSTGHAGLALALYSIRRRARALVREPLLRYPGLDLPYPGMESMVGTHVDGVHWLNFLGQPVLGELGGVNALRSRLHTPEPQVQALEGERVVVTLGAWPEAGDLMRGHGLPAYRELARVLEPWMLGFKPGYAIGFIDGSTEEDVRRWWRRFLE